MTAANSIVLVFFGSSDHYFWRRLIDNLLISRMAKESEQCQVYLSAYSCLFRTGNCEGGFFK